MSVNIRYPNITARTEREQIAQIKSYLHQLVEQLNYALPNLGTGDGSTQSTETKSTSTYEVQGGELSYYELRSLIIQELQEIDTKFDQLSEKLSDDVDGAVDTALEENGSAIATQAAQKISFTLDEDGNLYYEVEE